jgi:UDP-GlcNAc:undecaprenyl-phosphate GlcNAc-1-phosphate transferase
VLGLILLLIPVAFAVAAVSTRTVLAVSRRAGLSDTEAMPGQIKERRDIPNTGGVGIVAGIILPIIGMILVATLLGEDFARAVLPESEAERVVKHLPGLRSKIPLGLGFVAAALVLHAMGLIDDRRPLGPRLKLAITIAPALAIALATDTRLLTLLDAYPGGFALSVLLTVIWFLAVTNALNFIDNMDGLSGGVAMIASACFLAAALMSSQLFVAAVLALSVGACAGFLLFNFPPAKIFMGDGGSLVLGFTLAFLTTRTTYTGESPTGEPLAGGWYAVFMPLVVLAVPLYDMLSVTLIRLRQGRSPMVGDTQHLSHRLVKRGLSRRAAVLVIWGMTAATGISGIALASLAPWQAVLVGVQTGVLLAVLAAFEFASSPARTNRSGSDGTPDA